MKLIVNTPKKHKIEDNQRSNDLGKSNSEEYITKPNTGATSVQACARINLHQHQKPKPRHNQIKTTHLSSRTHELETLKKKIPVKIYMSYT